jgi:hypothetical protein
MIHPPCLFTAGIQLKEETMKLPTTLALLLSAVLLASCANPRVLVPNQSTIMDMRNRVGLPTDIRFDRNGDELWEYAQGPSGYETYLVHIGKDGKVAAVTQLLTEERLLSIVLGTMSKPDVRHLLGRPSDETFFDGEAVWSWRFMAGVRPGHLAVRFNRDNTVKERMVILDPSMDGGARNGK